VAAAVDVPDTKPSAALRVPRSTVGRDSRRVQKAAVADRLSKTQQHVLKQRRPAEPVRPAEPAPEEKEVTEEEGVERAEPDGLLKRLGFANIERLGKPSD